jgi:hypothetical protein
VPQVIRVAVEHIDIAVHFFNSDEGRKDFM